MLERLERHIGTDRQYLELRLHRNLWRRAMMRRSSVIENSASTQAGVLGKKPCLRHFRLFIGTRGR